MNGWLSSEGRLECSDFGSGEEPVRVIFCCGGDGRENVEDDDEDSGSESCVTSFRFELGILPNSPERWECKISSELGTGDKGRDWRWSLFFPLDRFAEDCELKDQPFEGNRNAF